jgi:hypothetical protein
VRLDEEPVVPTNPSLVVDKNTAVLDLSAHHLRSLRIGAPKEGEPATSSDP